MNDLSSASGVPRWLVPALTVFATSGAAVTFLLVPFGDDGVLLKALLVVMFGGGFALGAANVVQAVVMTVSKRPGLLAFSRRAMLLVKLGLVPFYLAGGVLVALFGMLSLGFLPFGSTMPLLTIAPPRDVRLDPHGVLLGLDVRLRRGAEAREAPVVERLRGLLHPVAVLRRGCRVRCGAVRLRAQARAHYGIRFAGSGARVTPAGRSAARSTPSVQREPRPARPDIPGELTEVDDLAGWIERDNGGDLRVSHVLVRRDAAEGADFSLVELTESRVEGCSFVGCDFDRAMASDVAFSNCDFSNSTFSQANFTRCTFSSCKFTGADLLEAVLSRVEVRDSTFAYASVAKGKLEDVSVRSTDFSGADLAELRQRRVEFDDVRFAGTSFFRASLDGVDLSSCRLADIVLSDTMEELRGCSMDLFQAAGIARRLGVNVKD